MKRALVFVVAAWVLLIVPSAFGQQQVPMYFDGWDGNSWDGGGTGFYYGSINGTPVGPSGSSPGFLCDDFNDHIYNPEGWTAAAYNVSTLLTNWGSLGSNTFFGSTVGYNGYLEMAIAVEQAFSTSPLFGVSADDVSEVLWCITGGPGSYCSSGKMSPAAYALWQWVLNPANYGKYSASSFANLWLYVPTSYNQDRPQEMWGDIPVPEGGTALGYLFLAGASCFGAIFLRRNGFAHRT